MELLDNYWQMAIAKAIGIPVELRTSHPHEKQMSVRDVRIGTCVTRHRNHTLCVLFSITSKSEKNCTGYSLQNYRGKQVPL